MQEKTPHPETINSATHLDTAEKIVSKFLDALIDNEPEKMRAQMSESFQASFDFSVLDTEKATRKKPVSFKIARVSKEAGSFNVVVDMLIQDTKNGKQNIDQKQYNLIEDIHSKKLMINSEQSVKNKQPLYKKPLFWIALLLGFAVIIGGTYAFLQNKKISQDQQAISSAWHDITVEAGVVNTLGEKASKDKTAYDDYSKELHTFATLVADKKFKADQLSNTGSDKNTVNSYRNALSGFGDYINEAALQGDAIADFSSSDFSKLNDLANTAQNSVNNFQSQAKFLQDTMPDKIYTIADVLNKVKDQINAVNEKNQAAKDAAAAAVAKDAADKTTVTNNMNIFQQGFIAGNANTMRPVMTTGFQGEYNFSQLNPDQRQYQYPSSFRIITVAKQPDNTYKAQVNVLYKYTDNANQYTQGYTYSVISSNAKWLINNESVGNSF